MRWRRPRSMSRRPRAVAESTTARRVARVWNPVDEVVRFQSRHELAHRRTGDLLGVGQLAHVARATEHEDRQRRQAGGRDAERLIRAPEPANEMDRDGVEVTCERIDVGHACHFT